MSERAFDGNGENHQIHIENNKVFDKLNVGNNNQILVKNSNSDFDFSFKDFKKYTYIKKGGSKGNCLSKNSDNDRDLIWEPFSSNNYPIPSKSVAIRGADTPISYITDRFVVNKDNIIKVTLNEGYNYKVSPGTKAMMVFVIGGGNSYSNGPGGATSIVYIPENSIVEGTDLFVVVGSKGINSSKKAEKYGNPSVCNYNSNKCHGTADGAKYSSDTKYPLYAKAISEPFGLIGYGGVGVPDPGWGANCGLFITDATANIQGNADSTRKINFPGGGRSKATSYDNYSGDGLILIWEFGGDEKYINTVEKAPVKKTGKKYANILSRLSDDLPYRLSDMIDYDPTGLHSPGVYVECPDGCISGWYYIKADNIFLPPPKDDPYLNYHNYNKSKKIFEKDLKKEKEYNKFKKINHYQPLFLELQNKYNEYLLLDKLEEAEKTKIQYEELYEEYIKK